MSSVSFGTRRFVKLARRVGLKLVLTFKGIFRNRWLAPRLQEQNVCIIPSGLTNKLTAVEDQQEKRG